MIAAGLLEAPHFHTITAHYGMTHRSGVRTRANSPALLRKSDEVPHAAGGNTRAIRGGIDMSNRIAPLMALGCLAGMSSAYATDAAPDTSQTAVGTAASAATADGGLQEVVVTAQRRSE